MDNVFIHKNYENLRLCCESNGHFTLTSTRQEEAKFKLSKVRSTQTCQKGIPYLNTYDGRILRYANPLIKANDSVKIDLKTNKIVEAIKLDVGSIVMVTGGRNRGCIGVINKREKHKGNVEIIHVQDSQGQEFSINLCHVLTIGNPWRSSKEIVGEDDNGNGSQLSESGVTFEMPNTFKNSKFTSDSEDEGAEGIQRMKGLKDLEAGAPNETSFGEVSTLKRRNNRRKQLTKVLESSAMLCGDYIDSKCSHNNSDSTGVSFENCSSEYDCDAAHRLIPNEAQRGESSEDKTHFNPNNTSKWQSKGKRKARHKSRIKKRDLRKYLCLNTNSEINLVKSEEICIFHKKSTLYSNGYAELTSQSESQKQLPYRRSRSLVNSRYKSSYDLGKNQQPYSKLYNVNVEGSEELVQAMEVPVEALEEGFCDKHILGTQKSRSLSRHSSKKMRKLSSLTGERMFQRRKGEAKMKEIVGACVPLSLVFNRIHESLNTKSC